MPRKVVISGLFFPHGDIKYVGNAEDLHIVPCPKLQEMTDQDVEFLRKESMDAELLIVALFGTEIEKTERLGLQDIPAQKVLWAFDSHHCLENDLKYQHMFDKYILAHSQYVNKFDKVPTYWVPASYIRFDIDTLKELRIRSFIEQTRMNDVVFPCNLYNAGKRKVLVESLKRYLDNRGLKYHIGPVDPGMPYMDTILHSKVTLNISLLGDLNIRNFEAWALNRPIITDMVEDFQKLQNVDMSMTYFFKRDFSDFETALNQALAVKQVKDTSKAVLNNHMLIHRYIEIINISLDTNYYVKNVFGSHSESNINVLGQNSCSEPAQNINSLEIKNSPTVDGSLLQLLNTNNGFSGTQFYNARNPVSVDFTALKHIVWLRIDSIGDVILANSMIPYIRKLAPNAKITVICQDYIAELFQTCPYINNIVTFDRKQMLKDNEYAESVYSKVNQLDVDCILNSVQSRNSICDDIIKYSNAPIRIGMIGNLTNCTDQQREERNKHYTHLINSSGCKTELDHHAEFIRTLGSKAEKLKPIIWLKSQSKKTAEDWLRDNDLMKKKTIVLAAGAQSLNMKQYPHYGKAIVDICKKNGFSVVTLGSKQDFDINQRNLDTLNAAGIRTFNLSGQTTIQQAAAVIDNCRLVVGLDNGLGHIACALEIPNVLILWGKHFGRFHPYSKYSSIVCLPLDCFGCDSKCKFPRMYCVDAVDPQVISHAVHVSLGSSSSKPRVFAQRPELFNPSSQDGPLPNWKMFDGLVNMSSIQVVESPSEKHQSNSQKEPYLSIIVTSRNDDHGGNGLHRMQVFAKGLADQCRRFNLNAELIIVDWNPPVERKSLYEVLEWPLDLGPLTVCFITVPKKIHNKIDNSDKFGLFQWIAKNVGIRRANGKFILSTNIDILFSDELIQFIASKQLNEDCFYRIDRHDVGCKKIPENLNTKGQLEFCNKNIIRIQGLYGAKSISEISSDHFRYTADDIQLHTNASGDFTLMARDKWHHFRGYPELGKGDLYIDSLIVHMAHVAGLKQVILQEPMRIYHIEHDEGWIARKDKNPIRRQLSLDYNKEYKSWCRKMLVQKCVITNNGKDWGYPESQFEEKKLRGRYKRDVSKNKDEKIAVDKRELFRTWIGTFAKAENRFYYRDQSSESLNTLANLVKEYKPTKIVELGTLSGMSLRTWLAASNNVEVIAVALSFKGLYKSRELIPVDLTRVRLLEQNILQTDFPKLWSKDDRVIFYVDTHDLEHVPIMAHVLNNALLALPEGSCFVVDDLWYCPKAVTNENVLGFFDKVTTNEVDSLQCFEGYCAPYWKGGFFIGFREVVPLLEWVNRHKVELEFVPGDKAVMFRPSSDSVNYFDEKFDKVHFDRQTGVMSYSPVGNVKAIGDNAAAQQANTLCQQGIELFAKGKTIQSLECLRKAVSFTENIYGILYAQAACLAKAGQLDLAAKLLELELKQKMPHPRAHIMLSDIERHLNKDQEQTSETIGKQKKQGLTIFTIPKAFKGHAKVIQRNAIKSWMAMEPSPEIILFGTDDGTAQVAQEFGLRHVPDIKCNEYGTPLIDDIFGQGQDLASNEIIAYVNADMILFDNFAASAKFIADRKEQFLMIGKRWDVDITGWLDFNANSWRQYVIDRIKSNGQLHGEFGIDYFVFKNGLWPKIPPFAIGRTTWDNWFVYEAIRLGHPVINVSGSVVAVHQNHDYGHLTGGKKEAWHGPEAQRNLALGGGQSCKRSIEHASLIFKDGKFIETIPLMTEYAQSLLEKGDIAFALKAFRRATEIDPKNIVLHNNYALALQQVGDNDNALKSFSNVLKLDPLNRETVLNMHSLYVKMGLSDEAKKLLSTYLQNNPQDKKIIHESGNKDLEKEMSSRGTGKKVPRGIISIPPGSEADKINSVRYARGVGEDTGKIFVIPVKPEFMPATMAWPYPAHNDYYGVEQDFLAYLYANNELLTHDWRKAKWHYLPVYWQHWMFLNDYGKKNLHLLDAELKRCIVDDMKTFTVCLYSNLSQVHIGRSTLMLPSRNIDAGIDIPLLCTYHKLPQKPPPKRYLANFVGRLSTGDIRGQMIENLKGRNDVFLAESETGTERFAQAMLESYIALSPRGYGGDSFRFYEAMQLGTTPFFIGDLDTRPFKSFIDWDQISLYAPDASNVSDIIDSVSKERLMEMGKNASRVFAEKLCYQKWCAYALKELELIDSGLRQRQEILI